MNRQSLSRTLGLALLSLACSLPAHADSVASSASSAGSASSASVSDSLGASSNSSGGNRRVAAGQYRVIDIALAPGKGDRMRLTLRAVADGPVREFYLDLPEKALAGRQVAKGELVQVNERAYGYEFAHADTQRAFFLALHDDVYRELASRPVTI